MVYRLARDAYARIANSPERREKSPCEPTTIGIICRHSQALVVITVLLASVCTHRVYGRQTDSTRVSADSSLQRSSFGTQVEFVAGDSLILQLTGPVESASLFGRSTVKMSGSELSAWKIDILFDEDELQATGLMSDSGWVGKPTFTQGKDTFEGVFSRI